MPIEIRTSREKTGGVYQEGSPEEGIAAKGPALHGQNLWACGARYDPSGYLRMNYGPNPFEPMLRPTHSAQ